MISKIILFSCVLICQASWNNANQSNEFDKLLSPRTVKTKYGLLQGILISLSAPNSSPSSPSSSSSQPSSSASTSSASTSGSSSTLSENNENKVIPNESASKRYRHLNSVEAFLGVPYAAPPVNSLRFMPPVTPGHWRGVRHVNHYQPVCPQKIPKAFDQSGDIKESKGEENLIRGNYGYFSRIIPFLKNQSEDCLYLNVYLPLSKGDSDLKLPVMVFIHGESYNWGSGNTYEGTILAAYGNIVVVTVNYRLGLFGFLPTVIDGATRGNHGLMDIIAALHWIHDNIKEIGGDEKNITLVGHSRGAALVNLLMVSPMSQGLFSKVILMSGSALSSWSISNRAESYAKYLSKAVNCPNYDNILMVDCLRTKSMEELLKVDLEDDDFYQAGFGPIIDGLVIPNDPRILMESNNGSSAINHLMTNIKNKAALGTGSVQLMYGVTRVEAPILFNKDEEKQGIDLDKRDAILRTLVRNMVNYYQEVISLTLINEYTDWSVPSEHPINILDSLIDILGDALVVAPITRAANLHYKRLQLQRQRNSDKQNVVKSDLPSVYSYVFVYQSETYGYSARLGCVHGDELPYLFGAPLAQHYLSKSLGHFRLNYSKPELTLSEMMINQWTNFVKYGNPNGLKINSKDRIESLIWPEYDTVQRKYLMIGMKPKIRDHYHSHRLSFWLNLIPKLERHGKEESDHLKRHLQDQEILGGNGQVSVFERISLKFLSSLQSPGSSSSSGNGNGSGGDNKGGKKDGLTLDKISSSSHGGLVTSVGTSIGGNGKNSGSATSHQAINGNGSVPIQNVINNRTIYSTALSLTIAIGVVLLTINGIIFGGVYYYINKHKVESAKKFSPVRYVDLPSGLGGPSGSLGPEHYTGFCCENHHLCTFTTSDPTGTSPTIRGPSPVTGNGHATTTTCHISSGQPGHHQPSSTSHVSLQPSPMPQSAGQQQQQLQSQQQGCRGQSDPCESKVTSCQCDSCYHQSSICDNGHCLTVIHEFDEHL